MTRKLTFLILILFALGMTACGSASNATTTGSAPMDDPSAMELPASMELVLGSFELEGSDQAITAAQAAELLPLWQVYKSLSESDSAAQAEIEALLEQIQETMTPEQMSAIEAMQLTREDMRAIMEEQGITMGGGPGAGNAGNTDNQGGGGFAPPDGGMLPGGMPGGGPGMQPGQGPGGQTLSPEQIATAQAARAQGGGFDRVPPALLEAFIQFLEERAGS
jgi:predicted outer membrane protein